MAGEAGCKAHPSLMALPAPAVNALPSPARRGKNTAMSKSLKRVRAALEAGGVAPDILEMAEGTRTAADAARAAGCDTRSRSPPLPAHRSPSRRNRSSPRRPRSVALPLAPCCCLEQPTRSTSSTRRSTGSLATVRRRCRRTACRPLPTPGPPMRATGLRRARRPRMASCPAGGAACRRVRAGELCFTERLQCVFSAIQCRRT